MKSTYPVHQTPIFGPEKNLPPHLVFPQSPGVPPPGVRRTTGVAPVGCGLGEVSGGVAEQVRTGPQPVATDQLAGALGGGGRGVKLTRTS